MSILRGTISRSLLAAFVATCAVEGVAQGLYNESTIFITGVNVYVDGEIENNGSLDNDGYIGFTGDWNSAGQYKGGGVVNAYGSTPQRISHHDQKFASLQISGWGTKYVKGSARITRELHLREGVVEVSPADVFKLDDHAVIHGGGPESYVDGAITTEGTGYKFFPVGKNGTYAPIEFLDIAGEPAEFSVEVFENAPVVSVEDAIVKRGLYWQRTDLSGAFGGSRVAIDFERADFNNPENIILLAGDSWDAAFRIVSDIERSAEADKILSRTNIGEPIIMLGEIWDRWTDVDFYLPTALSPNAVQAENRHVRIFGERLNDDGFRFQVFNRWGKLIFESRSLEAMKTNGWDGRSSAGAALPTGTYPYRLTAVDKTGQRFEKKGVITVLY